MANNSSISAQFMASRSSVVTVNSTTRNFVFLLFYGNYLDLPPGIWEIAGGAFSSKGAIDFTTVTYGTANGTNGSGTPPVFNDPNIEILANSAGYANVPQPLAPISTDYMNNGSDQTTVEAPTMIVSIKAPARIYVNGSFESISATATDCAVSIYAKRVG